MIATVKDMESLEKSFETDSQIIFILLGDICNISEIVERVKTEGRIAMVHLDLVSGFDGREIAVDFIRHNTRADGIISTKTAQINRAKELGLYAVHRFLCWIPVRWKISDARVPAKASQDCHRDPTWDYAEGELKEFVQHQHIPVIAGWTD